MGGFHQCQYPGGDIIPSSCKVFPHWERPGKWYRDLSVLFLTDACESTISK